MTSPFDRTLLNIMKMISTTALLGGVLLVGGCDLKSYNKAAEKGATRDELSNQLNEALGSGNASASGGLENDWPKGTRIVDENGVTYRLNPDGTRVRLGDNDVRIVAENGVRYRVDRSGTRVRLDDRGLVVEIDGPQTAGGADPRIARLCRSADLSERACASLNDDFRNLEDGVGALNAPAEMTLGQDYTAALTVGRDEDETQVRSTARAEAGPRSKSEVGDVRLAQHMRVTLSGSAFRIRPEGAAERELGLSRQGTWRWQVTPTSEGPNSLVATVVPIAVLPDGRRLELVPARRMLDVNVSVTAEQRMGRVERFLTSTTGALVSLAALIAAISLIVWRIRTFGRKPE